jgi:hypothetical protein
VLTARHILPDAGWPHTLHGPFRALGRDMPEPRISRPAARLQALTHRIARAFLFVVAAVLAVPIVIFMRAVLTAHQVPRWQEELAQFLSFLD